MHIEKNKEVLTFYLNEDVDDYQISLIKEECIRLIDSLHPSVVILDFSNVSFVDSTGIGFVLARYKQCASNQCQLMLKGLKSHHRVLFAMSGLFHLIKEVPGYE